MGIHSDLIVRLTTRCHFAKIYLVLLYNIIFYQEIFHVFNIYLILFYKRGGIIRSTDIKSDQYPIVKYEDHPKNSMFLTLYRSLKNVKKSFSRCPEFIDNHFLRWK